MNKEEFWKIIDTVNESAPFADRESHLKRTKEELLRYTPEEIIEWHLIQAEYRDAAYRKYLWAASSALGAHDTDDGFIDFRSWLISRGKEVYMNALRDPDSLATVPRDGEKLNFEAFAYVAHGAYEEKVFGPNAARLATVLGIFDNRELSKEVKEEISLELPQHEDIPTGWNKGTLQDLFPKICKAQEPKDMASLSRTTDVVLGYVYEKGQCMEYVFYNTPENLANFIGSRPTADRIIITDVLDRLILNTIGNFIDRCPDKALLERVKKFLLPIQLGDIKAQPFFCPTIDEMDAYQDSLDCDDVDVPCDDLDVLPF